MKACPEKSLNMVGRGGQTGRGGSGGAEVGPSGCLG